MKKRLVILVLLAALNLWGARGFVVNSGSETLSKIDFDSGEVDEVFCVLGSMPNRVGLTADYAYVVNSGDNSVQKIDINTGSTITDIYIENSSNPYDIIIDEDHAYVTGGMINKVYKIDLNTDEVVNSVIVGGNPAGMAILNGKLYVGNSDYGTGYSNCSVSVIDLSDFSVEVTIPTEVNPQFLASYNGNIHVSCGGDWNSIFGKICIIDPELQIVTNTLNIGGVTSNFAIIQNEIIYVADGYGASLYGYDADTFEIIYDNTDPFVPGGTIVASNEENLFVLGGEWGQNFSVKVFDVNENLLNEYTVGLYATDIKIAPEVVLVTEEQLIVPNYNLINYPNPFNPTTTISFDLASGSNVSIAVYNVKGKKVKQLVNEQLTTGQHSIMWNGNDSNNKSVGSGFYFYQLTSGKYTETNKMILIK